MHPLRRETLANGLSVDFFDRSNRYFGDYWRVAVEVRCRIPVEEATCASSADPRAEYLQAKALFGDSLDFSRTLERMGVGSEQVPEVARRLVEAFLSSSASYLGSPDFPVRLIRQSLAAAKKGKRPRLVSR